MPRSGYIIAGPTRCGVRFLPPEACEGHPTVRSWIRLIAPSMSWRKSFQFRLSEDTQRLLADAAFHLGTDTLARHHVDLALEDCRQEVV